MVTMASNGDHPGLVWASIGIPSAASALDLVSVKAQQIVWEHAV